MNEVNLWAIRVHRDLVKETVTLIFDDIKNTIITSHPSGRVVQSQADAYALAARFKGVLYKHPYFKKKHIKILRSIIDRCGEAYYKKNPEILYISNDITYEWSRVFQIPPERIESYLYPLRLYGILVRSDRQGYVYKISDAFYNMMGPVAQYLVKPVDTRKFAEMMSIASGLASIYVIGLGTRERVHIPTVPTFLKLSMVYTLAGLNSDSESVKIDSILRLKRVDSVDAFFVQGLQRPVELWRSIRAEAFEYMVDNEVIEGPAVDGYTLNRLWVKAHEEGVRRYILRLHDRYRRYI